MIRLAFLGCGQATRMHSRTLARVVPDVQRYYASRDPKRAAEFATRFKGAGTFDGYDAAIRDGSIDVVLVATPPATHLGLTLRALGSSKHVIVEKPPFLHASDFDPVIAAERATSRRVFIAENYFYKPLAYRLREILAAGDLGEIRFLHINALKQQRVTDWRGDPALAGGGALFEGGVHWIDFVANIGLELRSVHGFRPGIAQPERSMLVVLEYANGAIGTLSYSWEIHSTLKGIRMSRIYGTAGTLAFESNGIFLLQTGRRTRIQFPGLRDIAGYAPMFRDFMGAIRDDREPQLTAA
ncbi:MAG: Gfo/Idh/MocA family protein, partial [Longimicrobiales bacterium]